MPKVEFNTINLTEKCICYRCPVVKKSKCIFDRSKKIKEAIKLGSKINPKKTDGLFCAQEVGKTDCDGLDSKAPCICSSCPIWKEKGFKKLYYCLKGDADYLE